MGGSAGAGCGYWWRMARDLGSGSTHGKEWRQGTTIEAQRGGGGGGGGGAFGNVTENEAPPPPPFLFIRPRGCRKASKGQFRYNSEILAKDSIYKIIKKIKIKIRLYNKKGKLLKIAYYEN